MKRLLIPLALLAARAFQRALAGGWATAGLAARRRRRGGDTWNAQVNILQHGETPAVRISPTVTIRNESTGEAKTFDAKPTDEAGVYVAKVIFGGVGKWSYKVYDSFTQYGGARPLRLIDIGTGGGGGLPAFGIIGIVGVALVAIVFFYWLSRRVRVRAGASERRSLHGGRLSGRPPVWRPQLPKKGESGATRRADDVRVGDDRRHCGMAQTRVKSSRTQNTRRSCAGVPRGWSGPGTGRALPGG